MRSGLFASGKIRLALGLIFICSLAFGSAWWRSEIVAAFQIEVQTDDSARPEAVFTNSAPITIPSQGNASLYPSPITVTGMSGNIAATPGSVKVTLNSFSHTFPDDVGIVLVGPTGAALMLQYAVTSDSAGQPATNLTYTISDDGASILPNDTPLTAGTFKPANHQPGFPPFPAPGPGTAYNNPGPLGSATFSSTFGNTAPNGQWSLYVIDFVANDMGSIAGGWTLTLTTASTPTPTPTATPTPTPSPSPSPTPTPTPTRPQLRLRRRLQHRRQ